MDEKTAQWQFIGSLSIIAAVLLTFAAILGMADSCQSGFAVIEIRQNRAAGCFEFWFNRYQTLVAGLLALSAAAYTAKLLLQQLRFMERDRELGLGDVIIRRGRELNQLQAIASKAWLLGHNMTSEADKLTENLHRPGVVAFHNKIAGWPAQISALQEEVETAYGGFLGGAEISKVFGDMAVMLYQLRLATHLRWNDIPVGLLKPYTVGTEAISAADHARVVEVAEFFRDVGLRIQDRSDEAKILVRVDRDRLHARLRELDRRSDF